MANQKKPLKNSSSQVRNKFGGHQGESEEATTSLNYECVLDPYKDPFLLEELMIEIKSPEKIVSSESNQKKVFPEKNKKHNSKNESILSLNSSLFYKFCCMKSSQTFFFLPKADRVMLNHYQKVDHCCSANSRFSPYLQMIDFTFFRLFRLNRRFISYANLYQRNNFLRYFKVIKCLVTR